MALDLSMFDDVDAPAHQRGAVLDLPIDEIEEDPDQPRKVFKQALLEATAGRIRKKGGIEVPIRVRPKRNGKYRIVDGARRFRASQLASMMTIRAIVEEDEAVIDPYTQVVMNLQREELKPMELAQFMAQRKAAGDSRDLIASELGMAAADVTAHLALLEAPANVLSAFEAGQIQGVGGAYELCRLHEKDATAVDDFLAEQAEGPITLSMIRRLGASIRNPQKPADHGAPTDPANQSATGVAGSGDSRPLRDAGVHGDDVMIDLAERTETTAHDSAAPSLASKESRRDRGNPGDEQGDGESGGADVQLHAVPFHNPDIENDSKPVKLDDPTRIKKPLLLANFEGDAVMVRLDKMPTTPGLAFVKYEDGRGEIEVVLNDLTNWTLTDSRV
ncbi:ParB/RepB/Spo0J family partition protein [Burkholderia pyrrocinia]|uniref:ParB/RepB/Spo0J family partition protein n=1 Tax=Burkholderia pyrrocinia TaxID=60550 RepID=UPI001BD0DDAE|nr:ParB/RepB/Spo0J family partition protein [Burkholderia pyrrocinia]QVN18972.1 ParB/RepB/Spo0J family partition protein [Burkholderia pyrrocinia]